MDSKYGNREFLCEYNLSTNLFEEVGLKVKDLYPLRNGYVIECDNSMFYMKKVKDEESIKIVKIIIDSFIEFSSDYNVFSIKDKDKNGLYYLLRIPINITASINDIKNISENLAYIHRNCTEANIELLKEINKHDIKEEFVKDFDNILYYKKIVDKYYYKNDFDNKFINKAEEILNDINMANSQLSNIKNTYGNIKYNSCLCLESLDFNNILVKENNCYFLDLDESYLGINILNLAEFILKTLSYFNYDIQRGKEIITEYNKVIPLESIDYKLMYLYLKYPKDLIQLINDYYGKRQIFNDNIFLNKFNRILDLDEEKKKFIEWFYNEYIN